MLWTAIVGRSGTLKSPALELALAPLRRIQDEAMKHHKRQLAEHEKDIQCYEKLFRKWKSDKTGDDPPEKPSLPVCDRHMCSDPTVEALVDLLAEVPRGLILVRDELSGWIRSFDAYKGGRGGDCAHYLEMHRAGAVTVDRKSGDRKVIHVPRAALSIAGGIQPDVLRAVLGREHFQDGLAARFLFAMPPERVKRWSEAELDPSVEEGVDQLFRRLLGLGFASDGDGNPVPRDIRLTQSGKSAWVRFSNEHAMEQAELGDDDLAAAFSKIEGYVARLALVVHVVRCLAGGSSVKDPSAVGETSIDAGVVLGQWFANETRRIYRMLRRDKAQSEQEKLADYIRGRGGDVTPRELKQCSRRFAKVADAEAALEQLVQAELGEWTHPSPSPKGGRPSKVFRLTD